MTLWHEGQNRHEIPTEGAIEGFMPSEREIAEFQQCLPAAIWAEGIHNRECCLLACWSPWHIVSNN